MKSKTRAFLVLTFALSLCCIQSSCGLEASTNEVNRQTRSLSLKEAFHLDSLSSSPLLSFMDQIGFKKTIDRYKLVGIEANNMLKEKGKPENIWWKSYYCVYQTGLLTIKSQENAVQLMLPVFVLFFLLVFIYPIIKTFFFKPYLASVVKPLNAEFHKDLTNSNDEWISEDESDKN